MNIRVTFRVHQYDEYPEWFIDGHIQIPDYRVKTENSERESNYGEIENLANKILIDAFAIGGKCDIEILSITQEGNSGPRTSRSRINWKM